MTAPIDTDTLEKLRARIHALQAKTVANGCTENEALAAAGKVAELLDRHDLSLGDKALQATACVSVTYETSRRKRMPLGECVGAIAHFCDCKAWQEKTADGLRMVFFGLPADAEAARMLLALVDETVRAELGRYKTSAAYARLMHQDRHLANASFALGMVTSIADKLEMMKQERGDANARGGRDLVPVKRSVVDGEFARLGLRLSVATQTMGRLVLPDLYDAGASAGSAFDASVR